MYVTVVLPIENPSAGTSLVIVTSLIVSDAVAVPRITDVISQVASADTLYAAIILGAMVSSTVTI